MKPKLSKLSKSSLFALHEFNYHLYFGATSFILNWIVLGWIGGWVELVLLLLGIYLKKCKTSSALTILPQTFP